MEYYLDYAASTPISENVIKKMTELTKVFGNPSSIHKEGQEAKKIINETNEIISNCINCKCTELYYTSGATMSNNVAIQGFLRRHPNARIIISAVEHDDIMLLADWIDKNNYYENVIRIPVTRQGFIDLYKLKRACKDAEVVGRPILCSIQMANSETGVLQNIKKISAIVHSHKNAYLHTDATQYIPHYSINVQELDIDMLSMSGQKINCIKGTGFLYVKENIELEPIIFGKQGLIGGTENVIGIGCLGEAFKELHNIQCESSRFSGRQYEILSIIEDNLNVPYYIVGSQHFRISNNIYMCVPDVDAEKIVSLMNEFGYYISSGSACSSGRNIPSHVALAYGLSEKDAKSCIRFSFNYDIKNKEIEAMMQVLNTFVIMLKNE